MRPESAGTVKVLGEAVARKIAAGEVIDRPNSVVRELMDNAIDAGAGRIDLFIEGGGIDHIRLVDDGMGMTLEDLKLCCLPHATSKITTERDLLGITSLGFRGEALSSIAASCRLEIVSTREGESHKLSIQDGKISPPIPWRGRGGTIIDAKDLFYSIPARRKFLKRPASEGNLCKKTFLEKALPFPDIHFQFSQNGKVHTLLPPSTLKERVNRAYPEGCPLNTLEEHQASFDGGTITLVLGRPEWNRRDKRYMQFYANKRRIDEYAFIQAMQYGYDEVLPGGVFPVCFAFVQVDPALVDFNIHPAKREARFRNKGEIHHIIVQMLKNFVGGFRVSYGSAQGQTTQREFPLSPPQPVRRSPTSSAEASHFQSLPGGPPRTYPATPEAQSQRFFQMVKETPPLRQELPLSAEGIRYIGQILKGFLLAEMGEALYIIDQHAAHERLLIERYKSEDPAPQTLLIPYEFEASPEEAHFMETHRELFQSLGISFRPTAQEGVWEITALPKAGMSLEKEISDYLKCRRGSPVELQKELYATMSCRNAIKEGDSIDPQAALALFEGLLTLESPRCPHGRLLWFRLKKEELYELVGRTF